MKLKKPYRKVSMLSGIVGLGLILVVGGPLNAGEEAPSNTEQGTLAETDGARLGKLPAWLKLSGEFRARAEFNRNLDFKRGANDSYYLNRLRFGVGVEPNSWVRFRVEGQSASAPAYNDRFGLDSLANTLDFRQAYVELGRIEGKAWGLRLGRQEMSFGDERLIAADNYWDNLGRTFDAVRVSYSRTSMRLDWFASFLDEYHWRGLDRPSTGNQLYGFYSSFTRDRGKHVIEPYLLWKSSRRLVDESGVRGHHDVYTYGLRTAGDLPARFEYNVEMAFQRGHMAEEPIAAWAGHWEIGYRLGVGEESSSLAVEYNFGSGDGKPGDGRRATFDDLYPAGYNGFGMIEPFAWVNIHNVGGGLDWKVSNRWHLNPGYRLYWLADRQDGLYLDAETCLTHNTGSPSSYAGSQAILVARYEFSEQSQLYFGYSRFFPGAYLRHSSFEGALSTPYVLWNHKF